MGLESKSQLRGETARQYEDLYAERLDERRSQRVNELRLNGDGYNVALQTLQQQFPYFLKTPRYESFNDFTAKMRLDRQQVPRGQKYVRDDGYVSPGNLRPKTGYKQSTASASTAQTDTTPSATTGTTPTPPAASTGTDAPSTAAPAEPKAKVTEGIAGRLDRNAAILDRRRSESLNSLVGAIGGIAQEYKNLSVAQMTLDEAVTGSPESQGAWFLTRTPNELRDLFTGDLTNKSQSTMLATLQDKAVMRQAFRNVLLSADLGDEDVDEIMGDRVKRDLKATIGGQTTVEDAAEWAADQAASIATLTFMKDPFVQPANSQDGIERHTGIRPQAFADIIGIADRAGYAQMLADNPDVAEQAVSLMQRGDGQDLTPIQIGERASKRIKMINSLEESLPNLRSGDADALASVGLDVDDVSDEFGVTRGEVENLIFDMNFGAERLKAQRAWTAAIAGRALQYLPGTDGGDIDPKAWSPRSVRVGKSEVNLREVMRAMQIKSIVLPSELSHLLV